MQEYGAANQPLDSLVDDTVPITDWVSRFDDESIRELMTHYRPLLYAIARRHWKSEFQARIDPSRGKSNYPTQQPMFVT